MMDKSIMVYGLAVLWEAVLEFVGSKVCLDGNARHAIAHTTAQANKCRAKWKLVLNSPWLPRLLRLNIVKTTMWQAFLWSSSVWTTVKAQRDKIASWSARMVAIVVGVKKPPKMELGQWWRLWHRTGHRWIEKCSMNVLVAIRDRMLSWAGHVARMDYTEICAKALRCRGLQWWRWRQLNWKEVEKDKWSGHTHSGSKSTGRKTWSLGKCPNSLEIRRSIGICPRKHGLVASCSKPWKLETVFEMWKEPSIDGPGCLADPCASGMTGTNAGAAWSARKRNVRAGYGWLDSYCSGYGRRRGCGGIPEDVWFCVTCRMDPWRCAVEVFSWNVSGNEFLSQSSLLKTGVLKLGMTDFFNLGELIPRPKTMKGAIEPMRARATHIMVINTWMNPNTEKSFTQPLYLSCVKFCADTIVCMLDWSCWKVSKWIAGELKCYRPLCGLKCL